MKAFERFAACGAAIMVLSAQAPAAPAAPAASPPAVIAIPLKMPRHLEYALSVSYVRNGEGHDSGFGSGGTVSSGSGVDADFGSGGRRGSIDADVVAFTSDGGLVIQVNEVLQSEPRPEEHFTCYVYGEGRTSCPAAVGPLTDAESVLLSYLGRGAVDPATMDAQNHWRHTHNGSQIGVVSDYTLTDKGSGIPVAVTEHTAITSHVQTVGNTVRDVKVAYDLGLSVPDDIHSESHETYSSVVLQTTIDLHLTKDSFAHP